MTNQLAEVAKKAGDLIAQMQDRIVNDKSTQETKYDGSVVTLADKEAHKLISELLKTATPQIAILSEEGEEADKAEALKCTTRYETDPLDNTGGYVKGLDGWSVNIGLVVDGVPVEGAIYFPARKELYFTNNGNSYLQIGDAASKRIHAKRGPLPETIIVAGAFSGNDLEFLQGRQAEVVAHPGQYRAMVVARADDHITSKCGDATKPNTLYNTWDLAGPDAVARNAGCTYIDDNGNALFYGTETEKLPPYKVGANDTLRNLGLVDKTVVRNSQAIG